MNSSFSVPLSHLIKEFSLEKIYIPPENPDVMIQSTDLSRPGLNLTGFYEYFDPKRIQVVGRMEYAYLEDLSENSRRQRIFELFEQRFPCLILTRGLDVFPEIVEAARQYGVTVLRTSESTSGFTSALISTLNTELAPRITRHGVLIEIYGEGVLLLGESGVGKSETAIELVKRGHRLVADDAVEIRRVSNKTLVGSSPENIRHFLELRGIGIINARRLFGMGSVKVSEKIDMVVKMEVWDPEKVYDRMGMEEEFATILGLKIPCHTIPIKPGRNLAIILEVAAMNNRQKKMGYNAAQELMRNLGMPVDTSSTDWEAF